MQLYGPGTVLPSQYIDPTGHRCRPEMELVAAILEDALHCIARHASTRTGRRRRDFLDAYQWLLQDRRDWPFAFANVCDLLGLEPSAVRHYAHRLIDAQSGSLPIRGERPGPRRADC